MKKFLAGLILILTLVSSLPSVADAAVYVRGYYRSNGTYVQPHYRSNPDGNPYNNYSYPGNTNPYTGVTASGNPDTYLNNYYNRSSVPSYSSPTYSNVSSYAAPATVLSSYETVYGGYKSYGILFCNSGYYESGNGCKKAPENGYALYSDFACNSGFEKSGDQCVRRSIANAYWNGTSYSCNPGYTVNNSGDTCIPIADACVQSFGIGARAYDQSQCICSDGYEWNNSSKTACVKKYTKPVMTIKSYVKNMVDYSPATLNCQKIGYVKKEDVSSCELYKTHKSLYDWQIK